MVAEAEICLQQNFLLLLLACLWIENPLGLKARRMQATSGIAAGLINCVPASIFLRNHRCHCHCYLFTNPTTHLSIYLPNYLSARRAACLPIYLSQLAAHLSSETLGLNAKLAPVACGNDQSISLDSSSIRIINWLWCGSGGRKSLLCLVARSS